MIDAIRAGLFAGFFSAGLWCASAEGGAWTLPEGETQIIVSAQASVSGTEFDERGQIRKRVRFDKAEMRMDAEYGITDWATANIKTSLQRLGDPSAPTERYTEVLDFEVAARLRVLRAGPLILSGETRVYVPGPSAEVEQSKRTDLGTRDPAYEGVALMGIGFDLWGVGLFSDVQFGARSTLFRDRVDLRGDVTLGVKPTPNWEIYAQAFNFREIQTPEGAPRRQYHKVQVSTLHRFGKRYGLQTGLFRTIAGRSVVREQGGLLSLWVRF